MSASNGAPMSPPPSVDPPSPEGPPPSRSARAALLLGLALGLGIATSAILKPVEQPIEAALPPDAAALVNGTPIGLAELERAMTAVAADSRNAPVQDDRAEVLDRLIDQELLVQRAYELELDRSDRMVRNTLLSAMVQSVLASAPPPDTSDASIRAFYEANASYFARTGRVRIRAMKIGVDAPDMEAEAQDRADAAVARLRLGESFESVRDELGGALFTPLPDVPLPPSQLVNYLGPSPARMAVSLNVGEISEPVRGGDGFYILKVIERERGEVPALEDVRTEVINEMHRQAGEVALQDYLKELRAGGDIRKAIP